MKHTLLKKIFILFLLISILPILIFGARITIVAHGFMSEMALKYYIPQQYINQLFYSMVKESIIYIIYIIIIVVIVSIFFAGSIVNPIYALNKAVKRIKDGEYGYKVPINTNDELQELGESLNEMSEKLRYTIEELRNENIKRKVYVDILVHDLSNLITLIGGFSDILLEEETDPAKKRGLGIIRRNCDRIQEIVQTTSRLSKLEEEKKLNFVKISLKDVIEKVVDDFSNKLKEKNMIVVVRGENIEIDANNIIDTVFSNLISNAIKYSPAKTVVTVHIKIMSEIVRIDIIDKGEGVLDKYKEVIFERFLRGKKTGVKGTGLGLAIVKTIVDMHHGKVWVENAEGGGAAFVVELPIIQKESIDSPSQKGYSSQNR